MKLLADENIEKPVVEHLRSGGHDVTYVLELATGITDNEVLDISKMEDRVLLTSDKDFGELVFRRKIITTGVLLLRLAGLSSEQKAKITAEVLHDRAEDIIRNFTVIMPGRVRIRSAIG